MTRPEGSGPVSLSSITISGQVVACSGGCQAIVDTGKPLAIGPQSDIDNIDTLVGVTAKNGEYTIGCSDIPQMPDVTFHIQGQEFTLPSSASIHQSKHYGCLTGFDKGSNSEWLLGDVFLRQFYSIYSRALNMVDVAKAK
ncbi:LOW QUALITY PROTEIN: chymosin-like [Acanthopagrus latus]|uniref:LOW QUALITY PROTEIN: chymosin-like n=1 Tax=Acanthopagrus latus TaxID=8177 RepID=UPI00187C47B9|nr:LOW QUALITY PROTEIN: chymosin-like [Acanthopagrus latus]